MMMPSSGLDQPDVRPFGYQYRGAPGTGVSNLSTNLTTHGFLRDGSNPSSINIEDLEDERRSSTIIPDRRVPESVSSLSSSPPEEEENVTVPEMGPASYNSFRFRMELPWGRPTEAVTNMKEHMNAQDFTVHSVILQKAPGSCTFYDLSIEVKSRKMPEALLWDATQALLTMPKGPRLIVEDDGLFSAELRVGMAPRLNSLNFCSRTPTGKLLIHWTVSYRDPTDDLTALCCEQFHADFCFDQMSLNIHSWTPLFDELCEQPVLLSHGLIQIELKSVRSVIVSPILSHGKISMILEVGWPVALKRRTVPVKDLDTARAFLVPEIYTINMERGEWPGETPAPGVLAGCRHICLDMDISSGEFYKLLSRIHQTCKADIIFEAFEEELNLMPADKPPFLSWLPMGTEEFNDDKYLYYLYEQLPREDERLILTLRLKALAGINISTKYQLLFDRCAYEDFYKRMINDARENFQKCVSLLEAIMLCLERTSRPTSLFDIYNEFFRLQEQGQLPFGRIQDPDRHYELAEMVELTPSGIHYKMPELHHGNLVSRLLSRYEMHPMIRCALRSESGERLRWTMKGTDRKGEQHICRELRDMIKNVMMEGIEILGVRYNFFAASSSQMTELGMFLMDFRYHDGLRKTLGSYTEKNSHKNLAREGQCTSQSMECPIPITVDMWGIEDDKPITGYCKTDGAGRISLELMEQISKVMGIWPCVPEGFQFRFLCFKGMLFVDRNFKPKNREHIMFRKSQKKYEYGTDMSLPLQIIKFTGPQTANFCAAFINIIDQNSEKQRVGQERIREAILDLNENNFKKLAEASVEETTFRQYLTKLPYFIDIEGLDASEGFCLSQDPLFSGLYAVSAKRDIDLAVNKNRIPLDPSIARTLHGAPDDIGLLEEGEVYIETTVNVNSKFPGPGVPSTIWEGKVLLWKNPLGHPGDVRVVKCVNRPEYNGQANKLVFSIKGDRPLFDMLSGSDLDGDEYGVCLLEDIMPSENEEPMDYTAGEPKIRYFGRGQQRRVETYLHCGQNNSKGMTSVAHLVKSDENGLHSPISFELAKKACLSLDMPKSGIIAGPLRRKWITDAEGALLMPEFPHRRPDFKAVPQNGATYRSSRLNGTINRLNRQLYFISSAKATKMPIEVNPIMEEVLNQYRRRDPCGIRALEEEIEMEYENYSKEIQEIIHSLKLSCSPEAELFSGCHLSGKGFDRKESEKSNVNTKDIGISLAIGVYRKYRQQFFENLHEDGYLAATRCKNHLVETEDVLERTYRELTENMKKRAVVSYVVCYRKAAEAEQPILTYGWIGYDVLASVQRSFNHSNISFEVKDGSFSKKFEEEMFCLRMHNMEEYDQMEDPLFYEEFLVNWLEDLGISYGDTIQKVLFAFVKWANSFGLVDKEGPAYVQEISRLLWVVLYLGYGTVPGLHRVFEGNEIEEGQTFLRLFAGLASRELAKVERIPFGHLSADRITRGIIGYIQKDDIQQVYQAARKAYYALLINQDFGIFKGVGPLFDVKEREARIIELPRNVNLKLCEKKLREKTGAEDVLLQWKDDKTNRVIVMYRGSWETEEKLRQIVEVPPLQDPLSRDQQDIYYSEAVYASIWN